MSSARSATDALRLALVAAGWRFTRHRAAIFEHLCEAASSNVHPSADEVFQGVRRELPNLSLATVYKGLEALVASGLVAKIASEDGSARYDARAEHHYHLRCLKTGTVQDLPTAYDPGLLVKLDPDLAGHLRDRGFHLTGYRLELVGYFDESSHGG